MQYVVYMTSTKKSSVMKPLFLYVIVVNPNSIELFGLASEALGCDLVFTNFSFVFTGFVKVVGLKGSD